MRFINLLRTLGLGLCLLACSANLLADSKAPGKTVIKTTLSGRANFYPALRSGVQKTLDMATQLTIDDHYPEAIKLLSKMLEQGALRRSETAKIQQTLVSYYLGLNNYQLAYDATQAAVAADGLDNVEHLQMMYRGAQLLQLMDKFKESTQDFDKYEHESPLISGSDYVTQASNYFYQNEYKAAVKYLDKAFATGDRPMSNWYQFKATSLLQDGDFTGAVAYCKDLMARQPGNSQWMLMLVEAYEAMGKYPEAVALLNEAKSKGQLDSPDQVTQLYQLYAKADRYVEAVEVIDAGLAAGQLQTDVKTLNAKGQFLYEAAKELNGKPEAKPLVNRATDALAQSATADPGNGEAEFWLGQIAHFLQHDNSKAREYLVAATGKTLKHAGLAWYYLGGVEDHLNHTAAAKAALQKALNDPESKELAQSYLKGL